VGPVSTHCGHRNEPCYYSWKDEQRRYRVSGLDEDGDVHAFETNDLDRAEKMQKLMAEDLHHVELLTADPRAPI
jgi:hypothetical protein